MSNDILPGVWFDSQAKVWQEEWTYRSAIISVIREHNNTIWSALYMKLWEKKTILSISLDERKKLTPGIFEQVTKVHVFLRVLAKMLAEWYGITAFEIENGSYNNREDIAPDHKAVLMKSYPTEEFLWWIKEQKDWLMMDLPTWTNIVKISDDIIAQYLEASRATAQRMWAKEDPNLNLSWIVV
jgi:hypothetical protein